MNSRHGCLLGIQQSCCAFMFSVGGHELPNLENIPFEISCFKDGLVPKSILNRAAKAGDLLLIMFFSPQPKQCKMVLSLHLFLKAFLCGTENVSSCDERWD